MLVVEPNLPDPEILSSRVCTPSVLYTRSPCLGVWGRSPREFFLGCVLASSIADPQYWVNPRIFPLYFPYKRKHFKMTEYGMVWYSIVLYWKRDYESVNRNCSGFAAGCIPSPFQIVIKGLAISLWTQPIVWVNHVIIVSLCTFLMCFASCLLI